MQRRTYFFPRLNSFREYCKVHGFQLLPDDCWFINMNLNKFDRSRFKAILCAYLEEWSLGMSEAKLKNPRQAEGIIQAQGRVRANTWLRCLPDDKEND